MPLKLKLRPQEKVLIGRCIVKNITNGNSQLLLVNTTVVMREKDVIKIEGARTVGQKLYWAISELYISPENTGEIMAITCGLLRVFIGHNRNAPLVVFQIVGDICAHLAAGDYYRALKKTRTLIEHELVVRTDLRPENTAVASRA